MTAIGQNNIIDNSDETINNNGSTVIVIYSKDCNFA